MLVTVGTIFLCFSILLIVFFITLSKRQNLCFFVSFLISVFIGITLYVLEYHFDLGWNGLLEWINGLFSYLPTYPEDIELQKAFGYGIILTNIFIIIFIIVLILMNIFIPKEKYLLKKNRYYYVTKTIFVFVNIMLALFALVIILAVMNIIYLIPAPFMESVLKIFEQGLLYL